MEDTSVKTNISKFKSDIMGSFSIADFNLEDIIILKILQSDDHIQGKHIILFQIHSVKLVYKPRLADSDILVVSLFKK